MGAKWPFCGVKTPTLPILEIHVFDETSIKEWSKKGKGKVIPLQARCGPEGG